MTDRVKKVVGVKKKRIRIVTDEMKQRWKENRQKKKAERLRVAKEHQEQEREQARRAYTLACSKSLQDRFTTVKAGIGDAERLLREASQTIVRENRRLEELRPELVRLPEEIETSVKRFSNDFEHLINLRGVRRVEFDADGVLSVFTDTIFVSAYGQRWELGDYQIVFSPDGGLNIINVKVKELTGQTYYQHPHVFGGEGRTCLGNIQEGVYQLIAVRDYAVATQVLIDFLHTVRYQHHLEDNWKPLQPKRKKAVRK